MIRSFDAKVLGLAGFDAARAKTTADYIEVTTDKLDVDQKKDAKGVS